MVGGRSISLIQITIRRVIVTGGAPRETEVLRRANAMEVMGDGYPDAPSAIRGAGLPCHYALHDIMVHRPRLPLEATHGVLRQEATEDQPRHMDKN